MFSPTAIQGGEKKKATLEKKERGGPLGLLLKRPQINLGGRRGVSRGIWGETRVGEKRGHDPLKRGKIRLKFLSKYWARVKITEPLIWAGDV